MILKRIFTPYEQTQLARYGNLDLKKTYDIHQPVEYITGKVEFYNQVFTVTPDVLIPRVESEKIITNSVKHICTSYPTKNSFTIADVGTGSGAIGLSLHQALLKDHITHTMFLSDISEKALKIARLNYKSLNLNQKEGYGSNLKIIYSDLLEGYPKSLHFDLIIANLPYIPSSRIPLLPSSVIDYEPILALDGGQKGLNFIQQLLEQALKKLNPLGIIILEVDDTHTKSFLEKNLNIPQEFGITTFLDCFGKNRFCEIKRIQ